MPPRLHSDPGDDHEYLTVPLRGDTRRRVQAMARVRRRFKRVLHGQHGAPAAHGVRLRRALKGHVPLLRGGLARQAHAYRRAVRVHHAVRHQRDGAERVCEQIRRVVRAAESAGAAGRRSNTGARWRA